jgi:hypothetical protein
MDSPCRNQRLFDSKSLRFRRSTIDYRQISLEACQFLVFLGLLDSIDLRLPCTESLTPNRVMKSRNLEPNMINY